MQLAGPFLVKGTAIRSGLGVNPGDTVVAMVAGKISLMAPGWPSARELDVFGGGHAGVDNSYPAPTLPLGCLIATTGIQVHGFGPDFTFSPLAPGEVVLDVNAPPGTVYDKGWSVYLVRVEPAEGRPRMPFWEKFGDLGQTVDMSVFPPHPDHGPDLRRLDAVFFEGKIHLFWRTVDKKIGHLTFHPLYPDDPHPVEFLDLGWFIEDIGELSAAVFDGQLHVLYGAAGGLHHAMGTTGNWTIKTVDSSPCFFCSTAAIGTDELHVLFCDVNLNLRHGLFRQVTVTGDISATGFAWRVSTVDGEAPPPPGLFKVKGASPVSAGFGGIALLVDTAGQLHVFYKTEGLKVPRAGGYDLCHAVLGVPGDPARQWELETIDGAGHTIRTAQGQNRDWSGPGAGATQLADGSLHVFYVQVSDQARIRPWWNLRWAHQSFTDFTGENWRPFETIDGTRKLGVANPPQRFGRTRGRISTGRTNVFKTFGRLGVVYAEELEGKDRLRHAFMWGADRPNSQDVLPWMFELVDGHTTEGGRVDRSVTNPVAVPYPSGLGGVAIFYVDLTTSTIRYALLTM